MRPLTIKYTTSCRKCGATLPAGAFAFGERNEATGKWTFECETCHSKSSTDDIVLRDEDAQALQDLERKTNQHDSDKAATKVSNYKKELEILERNAKWAFSVE